jgi:serine/threonine protein phosphatase PrpC
VTGTRQSELQHGAEIDPAHDSPPDEPASPLPDPGCTDEDPPPPCTLLEAAPPDVAVPAVPPEASTAPDEEQPEDAPPDSGLPESATERTPAPTALPAPTPDPVWEGSFSPFRVGDPGRAATAPSFPAPGYWDVPDTVLDGVRLRNTVGRPVVELRAASVRGRAHRFHAEVRQDAYAYRCDGRFVVAAVADGVSSGGLSHLAAEIVSRHGCDLIASMLESRPPDALDWDQILETLTDEVLDAGRHALRPTRPDVDDWPLDKMAEYLSTTALFAVLDTQSVDERRAVHLLAHGDSSAWILRSGDGWLPQQAVKNAGAVIASSVTEALPHLPAHPVVAVPSWLGPADTLVLVSDGVGDPLGDGTGTVGTFLAQQWQRPPHPLEFAAHVDFARKSFDDDRTALALWPASSDLQSLSFGARGRSRETAKMSSAPSPRVAGRHGA